MVRFQPKLSATPQVAESVVQVLVSGYFSPDLAASPTPALIFPQNSFAIHSTLASAGKVTAIDALIYSEQWPPFVPEF